MINCHREFLQLQLQLLFYNYNFRITIIIYLPAVFLFKNNLPFFNMSKFSIFLILLSFNQIILIHLPIYNLIMYTVYLLKYFLCYILERAALIFA